MCSRLDFQILKKWIKNFVFLKMTKCSEIVFFQFCNLLYDNNGRKELSKTKRTRCIFKIVQNPKFMKLRFTAVRCSSCQEVFSFDNTTKDFKSWELNKPPHILDKLFDGKKVIVCSDCSWEYEAFCDIAENPML